MGQSKYLLGCLVLQCIVGLCDWWEFLEFSKGHWQSPCTALMAGKCLPLALCKETVKESKFLQVVQWPKCDTVISSMMGGHIVTLYVNNPCELHHHNLQNKCPTVDPDRQNFGWSSKLSIFIIYKFWQNCASVQQVSDLMFKDCHHWLVLVRHLFSAKPLPGTMLTYQLDTYGQISVKCESKYIGFYLGKMHLKMLSSKWRVSAILHIETCTKWLISCCQATSHYLKQCWQYH